MATSYPFGRNALPAAGGMSETARALPSHTICNDFLGRREKAAAVSGRKKGRRNAFGGAQVAFQKSSASWRSGRPFASHNAFAEGSSGPIRVLGPVERKPRKRSFVHGR